MIPEDIYRLLDAVGGFIDHPPRGIRPEDLHALGDRLTRLRDEAYMAGREAEASVDAVIARAA